MRCAVYIRVSTSKDEQKQSLVNQNDLFMNLLAERGWDLHDTYLDIETGTKSNKRPQLKRMIEDAKKGKFDIILAKELSRLARNGKLSYEIKDLAEHHGIDILTLDGAIDTLSGNTQMFGLYAWVYEQESQRTSERVKYALHLKSKNGNFMGSIPPYGYFIENKKLKVRKDYTVDVVKRIFSSYISGKGFDKIARELLEEGILTPSEIVGKKNASSTWNGSTIRCILSNRHYTGDLVQLRETSVSVTSTRRKQNTSDMLAIVENTHEAIVSKEDFNVVQQLMVERKRKRPHAKKHLFTNLAYCADCGKAMHFKANRKGYICGNYNKNGHTRCSDHLVKEKDLIEAIIGYIRSMFNRLNSTEFQKKLEKQVTKFIDKDKKRLSKIEPQIEVLKKEKVNALRMKVREEISEEEYQILIEENNKELNELLTEKKILSESLSRQKESLNILELTEQLKIFIDNPVLDESIIHKLIERIEITDEGNARVYFRFSNTYISSIFFSNTQHSTCAVCGNISTG